MFWTNRGCDTNALGPSDVDLPAMNHVSITPNQRVGTDRQFLDQSHSLCVKLKFKTVLKRLFHWLIKHPGVGVFLFLGNQTENEWLARWPACKEKWLLCCVTDTGKCLSPLNNKGKCYVCVLCFFSVFFLFVLEVCWHLVNAFSLLLFLALFSRCCLWRFCVPPPILTWYIYC